MRTMGQSIWQARYLTAIAMSVRSLVVSLDSVYGGKRSFDPHLADGEVQRGTPQWISPMSKGTFSARYGRTGELHHREAGLRRR